MKRIGWKPVASLSISDHAFGNQLLHQTASLARQLGDPSANGIPTKDVANADLGALRNLLEIAASFGPPILWARSQLLSLSAIWEANFHIDLLRGRLH